MRTTEEREMIPDRPPPTLDQLCRTRWARGKAEHRKNGETEYVGAPPEQEALEELADLKNYLDLMSEKWSDGVAEARIGSTFIRVRFLYGTILRWAIEDGVDLSGLDSSDDEGIE